MTLATLSDTALLESIDLHEEALAVSSPETAAERRLIARTRARLEQFYAELRRRAPQAYALDEEGL